MNETRPPNSIDDLLRRSLAAPVPALPHDFDERVMRRVRQSSQPLGRRARALLAAYAVLSVVVSALLMRSQGLGWIPIAAMILAPLVGISVAARIKRKPRRQQQLSRSI
jgi:hypothetical protein